MKILSILLCFCFLTSCGYTARNVEVIGQLKKIENETPLICPNMINVDLSLGVMRNGTGSMSNEDQWFYLPPDKIKYLEVLKEAQERGFLIKIIYDQKRVAFCQNHKEIVSVELTL